MSCEIFIDAPYVAFVAGAGMDVSYFEDTLATCARMFPLRAL